ncbi:hypothetical protein HK102_011651 [Quaeritorhiza haematococci]|nr:hypothetical protein HK102_011651 [Quaeritorhiza haematococci]
MSVAELAAVLGAPVSTEAALEKLLGLPAGALAEAQAGRGTRDQDVAYDLEAVHCEPLGSIVSLRITKAEGQALIARLWPDVDFWCAPGGSSIAVQSREEVDVINEILGTRFLEFDPDRHQWIFAAGTGLTGLHLRPDAPPSQRRAFPS